MLCGKPLIQWTIEAAEQSNLTTFVVSSEDYDIGRVASELGAYVVRRPDDLASDEATTGSVLKHALEWMGADDYDYVVCLHPTSPIRDPKHIDECVALLHKAQENDFDSVCSVYKIPQKGHYTVFERNSSYDSLRDPVMLNASIYALTAEFVLKFARHTGGFSKYFEMDRYHSLDIDEEIDFKLAELYMEHMKNGNRVLKRQ